MEKNCVNCSESFSVTESDLEFYKKIDVSVPTNCPACRLMRRMAFRNERTLFKRNCDKCKKNIISFFEADKPFPVYCSDCWWKDDWDPLAYGQDFDFSRPFFEQFKELMMKVPKVGMLQLNNENSEYNALIAYSKNAYMSPGSYFIEDSYYLRKCQYSKCSINCAFLDHCELLAYSINCSGCYNCNNLTNCRNCVDCSYLENCTSCQNCFMCSDVANRKFSFKNQQYSEDDYRKILERYGNRSREELQKEFGEFALKIPKRCQNQINCEFSKGDYLQNCKNAEQCYDCFAIEDSKYVVESAEVKDSMDLTCHDKNIELCYEGCSGGESNYNLRFSFCTIASPNSTYMYSCFYMPDCFGCDSSHLKLKNCILNKQYSETEYLDLKNKIIEHMKKTGEWGEFFPVSLSPHPYHYTMAQDYFPINDNKKDPASYREANFRLPNFIKDVDDAVTKEILACENCGKKYQIIQAELLMARKLNQPLSKLCADCRQKELMSLKNPRHLWGRQCAKCSTDIQTTYHPDNLTIVYCNKCYLEQVY